MLQANANAGPSPAEQFHDLVRQAKAGDRRALQQLAETYEKDVRIAARVHLGPALRPYLDSLDLVQSVHRSLLCGLRFDKYQFDGPNGLVALALLMVRRKAARQWRKHRRQQRLDHLAHSSDWVASELTIMTHGTTDPLRAVENREAVQRLYQHLDDIDRQLLELRIQGWSTAEAAQQLGHSPEALRIRLHRLRKRLAEVKLGNDWL